MNQITNEALEFLKEAKEQFISNQEYSTYRNQEDGFIALRTGMFDDCIMIYELGSPVGNFTQQLPRQHKVLIDYDEFEKHKKLKELVTTQIAKVTDILQSDASAKYNDYNSGYLKALEEVLKVLD